MNFLAVLAVFLVVLVQTMSATKLRANGLPFFPMEAGSIEGAKFCKQYKKMPYSRCLLNRDGESKRNCELFCSKDNKNWVPY